MAPDNNPGSDLIREDYDTWHKQMKISGEKASPLDFPWYASVWQAIKSLPGGNVLEIGCGRGQFSIWLAAQAPQFKVTGLDFSGAAIDIAKQNAAAGGVPVSFVQGDAQSLPFETGSFDLVISCECMEHVPSPPRMAQEIHRVMRPGARFCLTTENYLNGMLIAWLYAWVTRKPFNSGSGVQPRENFFLFWIVRSYLRKTGLIVDRMESSHYQWLLLPRVDPAKLCTEHFKHPLARCLAFPFGRHMSFFGLKPLEHAANHSPHRAIQTVTTPARGA